MLQFLTYSPDLKQAFYDINAEWISSMFTLEELDEKILRFPEEMLLQPGGHIFFVKHPELGVVGTCALRKTGEGQFELTKMGVLEKARGLKAGEALLQHVIQFVKDEEIPFCYLLTNSDCQAAIHLYEKNGFVHDADVLKNFGCEYTRCNVGMRLTT